MDYCVLNNQSSWETHCVPQRYPDFWMPSPEEVFDFWSTMPLPQWEGFTSQSVVGNTSPKRSMPTTLESPFGRQPPSAMAHGSLPRSIPPVTGVERYTLRHIPQANDGERTYSVARPLNVTIRGFDASAVHVTQALGLLSPQSDVSVGSVVTGSLDSSASERLVLSPGSGWADERPLSESDSTPEKHSNQQTGKRTSSGNKVNESERRRVKRISEGFDRLQETTWKESVKSSNERRPKRAILQRALKYIERLQLVLLDDDTNDDNGSSPSTHSGARLTVEQKLRIQRYCSRTRNAARPTQRDGADFIEERSCALMSDVEDE